MIFIIKALFWLGLLSEFAMAAPTVSSTTNDNHQLARRGTPTMKVPTKVQRCGRSYAPHARIPAKGIYARIDEACKVLAGTYKGYPPCADKTRESQCWMSARASEVANTSKGYTIEVGPGNSGNGWKDSHPITFYIDATYQTGELVMTFQRCREIFRFMEYPCSYGSGDQRYSTHADIDAFARPKEEQRVTFGFGPPFQWSKYLNQDSRYNSTKVQ